MSDGKKTPYLYVPEEGCPGLEEHTLRYLNSQKPTTYDLDQWIGVPLFQHNQVLPIDTDGSRSVLLAHVDTLRQLVEEYDRQYEMPPPPPPPKPLKREEECELEEGEIADSE